MGLCIRHGRRNCGESYSNENSNNKVDGKGGRNQEAIVSSINYLQQY